MNSEKNSEKSKIEKIADFIFLLAVIFFIITIIQEGIINHKIIKQGNCVKINGDYYCKEEK